MKFRDYPKVCVNLQTDVKTELLSMEVIFMARRKDSPQKAAMRSLVREYLKDYYCYVTITLCNKETCL